MSFEELLTRPQYSLTQVEKEALLLPELRALTEHHQHDSSEYARLLSVLPDRLVSTLADLPFVPVNLFKSHRLSSVSEEEIFKIMTSSGTTGQQVSQVILNRKTAGRQSQALAAIMTHVLGPRRLPMIVVDTPNVVKNRKMFSARGAGVLGMISYGRQHFYALDDDMHLDLEGLKGFLTKHQGQPILIFGFTFMVWKYFYEQLKDAGVDLSQAILIHSGGWKKLVDEAVDNAEFKRAFNAATGIDRIHNFYGMVEQVGSVFMEGDDGFLYPPNFADVIIRDPVTWEEAPHGAVGVIQVLSILPTSYPGHSILTEDLGVVHGVGDPANGWGGKQLQVIGRVPKAELRGCSDTHGAEVQQARAAR
ncbi:acyl-protein synthetase [Deinococcus sp. NW-56]|uniref:LuxE/PaaK family acyltransferase n=1 Tax=Deinococcus sp. NW-56 TaxID=2080419 RepID=UPI000CF576CD|nr:acyl-protein synthetase [Deinococcus sp. NW-56]